MNRLLPILLFCTSSALWSQSADLFFSAGQSLLTNSGLGSNSPTGSKDDYQMDDGFRFGFRFGLNSLGHFGHEMQYAYNRSHLLLNGVDQGGMAIHQGGYNFLAYATRDGARFRPFATGGVHFSNFVPPGASAASGGGNTKFGINYGGGIKVIVTSMWSLRLDVRQYMTPKPFDLFQKQGWLKQTEVSAGAGIHF
jgi:opacity protein-like surface antigen